MQLAGLTNRGRERARNEDNYVLKTNDHATLMVVADGMGGHRAGNVASSLVVVTAERYWVEYKHNAALSPEESRKFISKLITEANEVIYEEASNSVEKRGMGTTLTAGLLCGHRLIIGHVGDSRAYHINNGTINLLTRDHSLLEQLLASGQVKPEEAQDHPQRHVLTRALGMDPQPEIDLLEIELEAGAALLFCTDGLTNMVSDEEILRAYLQQADPRVLAEKLVEMANSRGGLDNITVVIATGIGGRHG